MNLFFIWSFVIDWLISWFIFISVFFNQSKFLPLREDTHIVSCARDGQVRLAELSSGAYKSTRKLAKHKGPAHKLATLPTSPHVVLSAGEDAVVLNIDIREEQPSRWGSAVVLV